MNKPISQAEFEVMEVLWKSDEALAAQDIARRLSAYKNWNIRTVKTLLSRLVEKDVLSTTQDGRRYLYTPLVSRKSYAAQATRRLSERLFGGKVAPLVAHLAQDQGLTMQDIAELETILQELKNEH